MGNRHVKHGDRSFFAATTLATYLIELLFAERKFALIQGGFGQSHTLRGPVEIGAFLGGTLLAHGLAMLLLWAMVGRLLPGAARRSRRLFTFVFFGIAISVAVLAARLELLSYFSDAVSLQLLRNLGGGSLYDAFLFALNESALYAIAAIGGLVVYGAGMTWLARRSRSVSSMTTTPLVRGRTVLALLAVFTVGAFAIDRNADTRYAARRLNAYHAANALLDTATDLDRDGYSLFSAQVDRYPFDASRHPFALDRPDDGIDQDGFAGDYHEAGAQPAYAMPPLPARPRHLVVIVLESTRFDALGKRIDGRPVMPNLAAVAARGSSIAHAYSQVGYTTESLKSLFTGRLDPQPRDGSLFRDLKRAGYRIGVFSGQPESFGGIAETVGERATADVYVDAGTLKDERASAFAAQGSLLVDEAKLMREFDRRMRGRWTQPTFVYFNFQSAHFPYHHDGMVDRIDRAPLPRGEIKPTNREGVARTYYNAVAHADHYVGEVVARLKALGVWNDTLLVVTADHGESLFDDGLLGHGHVIDAAQLHIPLVLSQPGVRIDRPVALDDYRRIIGDLLAGRAPVLPPSRVFQYTGTLDEPAAIGTVDADGRFTTFDLDGETVGFDETRRRYAALRPGSPERARADALIREWERRRWIGFTAREPR